jgi:hypothetical protein
VRGRGSNYFGTFGDPEDDEVVFSGCFVEEWSLVVWSANGYR